MSYGEIVGRLLKAVTDEGRARLEHVANSPHAVAHQPANKWLGLIRNFLHSKQAGNVTGGQVGGLGVLAGALLGGGAAAATGALGGSALSMLGALAINTHQKKLSAQSSGVPEEALVSSLPKEQIEAMSSSDTEKLIVQAMINAAKADGQLDQSEMDKIMGKAGEDGLTEEERQFIRDELNQPLNLNKLVSSVPNQMVATQVYAASLFAIDIDTEAEKSYLRQLTQALHLDIDAVKKLHEMTGSPAV
jgi:uncharacterized membrane protein YebE (DUF533 family)